MVRTAAGLIAALTVAATSPAAADGRAPASVKVEFRPGTPAEALISTTFGLLVTKDDGATWRWACEDAIGSISNFDPDYEYTSTGLILAPTFDGLRMTRDGCRWSNAPAPLGGAFVSHVAVGSDGTIWAAMSDTTNGNGIFKSTDDGASFEPTAPLGMAGDFWESVEVAPSDPRALFVTGFRLMGAMPRQRLLFRSLDGGGSWTELSTAALVGTSQSSLHVAAISPTDPGVVFVRVTLVGPTLEEAIYRSGNAASPLAAPAWTKVLDLPDQMLGVVVRESGEVWATTPFFGLHRSQDGGRTFAEVPGVGLQGRCLAERPGGVLYLCTSNLPPDGATLHTSRTGTTGWTRALRFADLAAPVRCAPDTAQQQRCEALQWCPLVETLSITSTEIACAGVEPMEPVEEGCCAAGAGPSRAAAPAVIVVLGLVAGGRRRRRRRAS